MTSASGRNLMGTNARPTISQTVVTQEFVLGVCDR
jgi:hypothetical protein